VTIPNPETPEDPVVDAIVYYPAQADGEETAFASGPEGPPLHLVDFGHANRTATFPPCPGTPGDRTQDYLQMSTILSHLVRWGFMCLSPEFVPGYGDSGARKLRLQMALDWLLGENGRAGSPFQDQVLGTEIVAMGHSAGGGTAVLLGADAANDVATLALVAPGGEVSTITGLRIPTLVLHSTNDSTGEGVDDLPLHFYNAAAPPKHIVEIGGANHFQYTDELCVDGGGDGTATIGRSDQQRIAMAYLVAFLRRYVFGAPDLDDYLNGVRTVEELEAFDIAVSAET